MGPSFLPPGGSGWELAAFVIGLFLQLLGLPFVAVSQVSLFSKVTSEKTQGEVAHVTQNHSDRRPGPPCAALAHRFQPGRQALSGGSRHHPGPAVGRRIDQSFVHRAGLDASAPADDHGERNTAPQRVYGHRLTEDWWHDSLQNEDRSFSSPPRMIFGQPCCRRVLCANCQTAFSRSPASFKGRSSESSVFVSAEITSW